MAAGLYAGEALGVIVQTVSWLLIGSKLTPAPSTIGRCASIGGKVSSCRACSRLSHTLTLVTYPCSRSIPA